MLLLLHQGILRQKFIRKSFCVPTQFQQSRQEAAFVLMDSYSYYQFIFLLFFLHISASDHAPACFSCWQVASSTPQGVSGWMIMGFTLALFQQGFGVLLRSPSIISSQLFRLNFYTCYPSYFTLLLAGKDFDFSQFVLY